MQHNIKSKQKNKNEKKENAVTTVTGYQDVWLIHVALMAEFFRCLTNDMCPQCTIKIQSPQTNFQSLQLKLRPSKIIQSCKSPKNNRKNPTKK